MDREANLGEASFLILSFWKEHGDSFVFQASTAPNPGLQRGPGTLFPVQQPGLSAEGQVCGAVIALSGS